MTTFRQHLFSVAALVALAFALYGRHLGDGYLADDFLYLSWLREGLPELLRRVTLDSDPRMIRPLPALAWLLSELPGGAALQHALSILLHGVCGALVARLAERAGGSPRAARVAGALFVAFPLFAEPVVWLSAAPDPWAACLALAALAVGLGGDDGGAGRRRLAAAAGLFALALLSKASVLALPLVALVWGRRRRVRRLALALGAVAILYLAARWWLFGGPGGYLDEDGRSLAFVLDPLRFARNLLVQVPYRLLVPFKRPGAFDGLLAVLSVALAGALLVSARPWHRWPRLARAVVAFAVAALPVAPILSVDADHESSRLIYFPMAILAAALGGAVDLRATDLRATGPRALALRASSAGLLVFWSLAVWHNGDAWRAAAREVRQTLAAMAAMEDRFPAGATVLVAGHDTHEGAYVWRNGLAFAARLAGLRSDVDWRLGTAALVARPQVLGRRVFEIGVDAEGRPRDETPCRRALASEPLETLATLEPAGARRRPAGTLELGPVELEPPTTAVAVEIAARPGRPEEVIEGRLAWRRSGNARFHRGDSRDFRLYRGASARAVVRLPAATEPLLRLGLRLELAEPEDLAELTVLRIVEVPDLCVAAPARR